MQRGIQGGLETIGQRQGGPLTATDRWAATTRTFILLIPINEPYTSNIVFVL
jgi:hypothetical protein